MASGQSDKGKLRKKERKKRGSLETKTNILYLESNFLVDVRS